MSKEENDEKYIIDSKKNIDNFIYNNNYRSAFGLLIMVLERLDDGKQKNEFIDYYSKNIFKMYNICDANNSHLNPRNLIVN